MIAHATLPVHSDLHIALGASVTVFVTALLTWMVAAAVMGVPLGSSTGVPSAPGGSGGTFRTQTVYLTIQINPGNGWPQYVPANFSVAAHVPVRITISNYDNGTSAVSDGFATVRGTFGGMETLNGTDTVSQVDPATVAHTFTIFEGGSVLLNAPVPVAAGSGAVPSEVSFVAEFNSTGTFTWNCMAPCGSGPMSTPGFMTGSISVE